MVVEYYHKCVYVLTEWKLIKKKIIWEFLSQIWEKHLIFALGIGAEIRPQNRPRKIPVIVALVLMVEAQGKRTFRSCLFR